MLKAGEYDVWDQRLYNFVKPADIGKRELKINRPLKGQDMKDKRMELLLTSRGGELTI